MSKGSRISMYNLIRLLQHKFLSIYFSLGKNRLKNLITQCLKFLRKQAFIFVPTLDYAASRFSFLPKRASSFFMKYTFFIHKQLQIGLSLKSCLILRFFGSKLLSSCLGFKVFAEKKMKTRGKLNENDKSRILRLSWLFGSRCSASKVA